MVDFSGPAAPQLFPHPLNSFLDSTPAPPAVRITSPIRNLMCKLFQVDSAPYVQSNIDDTVTGVTLMAQYKPQAWFASRSCFQSGYIPDAGLRHSQVCTPHKTARAFAKRIQVSSTSMSSTSTQDSANRLLSSSRLQPSFKYPNPFQQPL